MVDEAKPNKKVVGLQYEPGKGLPQVILKGSGKAAEAILKQRSLQSGPKVVRNEELLTQLYRLPMDAEIGPELFHLVARILAHVFSIEEKLKEERP